MKIASIVEKVDFPTPPFMLAMVITIECPLSPTHCS